MTIAMMLKHKLHFFQDEITEIDTKINKLKEELKEVHNDTAESTRQSSETWHDNYMFEEGQRQLNMITSQIDDLINIRNRAEIIQKPVTTDDVKIGHRVTFKDKVLGQEKTYIIGGYMPIIKPGVISYNSPVAKQLLGHRKGDTINIKVGGVDKAIEITDIKPA
ncbi:GreA/GreB family elongation factor [Candidatus Uhrbacteria bacterium]|nr:GreA/GreB family elongation factor [Candidatus Uhrbacteria bacterium]